MRRRNANRTIVGSAAKTLAALAVLLLAGGAFADGDDPDADADPDAYHDLTTPTSSAELGFLFNSEDSYKFGDYTGLVDKGGYALANLDINRRSAYDAERPYFYRVLGLNLGLDSRYVDAEYKWPGLFGLSFVFDELPKYQTDSSETFFRNTGSQSLMLPSGWVLGSNPTNLTSLDSDLRGVDIDHKRRILGGGASLVLPFNLDFDADYTHETKRGQKLMGAVLGTSGGNPRAVVIPEQLDYTTQQIDSHLRYTTDLLQLQLQYYGSGFDNDDDWTRWENPYLPAGAWPPRGLDGYLEGQKGQMPDNWFHQIAGSGGLNLPFQSRLTVNTAFGWMTQDDDFQPYTINPNILTPLGLPGNDLDGMVKTRLVNVQFLSNPIPKLGFKAAYRWNDRDNDTSVEEYFRVANDVGNQVAEEDARLNRPYSFEQHAVDVDLSYDIFKRTKLTAMYAWDRRTRDLQEVEENNEHSFGFKLVSRANRYVTGGARYERFYRTGSHYNCVRPLIAGEANPSPNLGCPSESGSGLEYENHPLMRKFYMADRHRDEVHSWINVTPIDSLSFGFDTRYSHDDYYHTTYGLQDRKAFTPGVDVTWTPAEWLSFHTFYNYEKIKVHQESISWDNDAGAFDLDARWMSKANDTFHTVGAGVDVDVIPNRLAIGLDYLFAKSRGEIDTRNGPALGPLLPFPDNITKLHDISVHSDVQITRNLSTRIGYLFEKYDSSDWAFDGVCAGCLSYSGNAAVIGTGQESPDYHAHVVSWSMKFEFW